MWRRGRRRRESLGCAGRLPSERDHPPSPYVPVSTRRESRFQLGHVSFDPLELPSRTPVASTPGRRRGALPRRLTRRATRRPRSRPRVAAACTRNSGEARRVPRPSRRKRKSRTRAGFGGALFVNRRLQSCNHTSRGVRSSHAGQDPASSPGTFRAASGPAVLSSRSGVLALKGGPSWPPFPTSR